MEIKVLHKQEKSSYKIRFTDNFNNLIGKNTKKYEKIAIVTDTNIYKLYRRYLTNNNVLVIKINPGEKSKSNKTKIHIE